MAQDKPRVSIEELYDGFIIIVDGERFSFDQEDNKKQLVDVFEKLGVRAKYTEVY